jgi:hypothetical protein
MLRIGEILLRNEQGSEPDKKGAQRPSIVPPENTLIMNHLFRQEVIQHPEILIVCTLREG